MLAFKLVVSAILGSIISTQKILVIGIPVPALSVEEPNLPVSADEGPMLTPFNCDLETAMDSQKPGR